MLFLPTGYVCRFGSGSLSLSLSPSLPPSLPLFLSPSLFTSLLTSLPPPLPPSLLPLSHVHVHVQLPFITLSSFYLQVQPHFSTSAPANLPSPPLYPGETIELQQDRIVCLDVFNEPAVGAVYITNFRVIFCGNLISVSLSLSLSLTLSLSLSLFLSLSL